MPGAWAAPGDVHRVTADRVNLRAGPSDEANIRSTVEQGDELVELRTEGSWLGVRVLETGEEGWIFGDLVEQVSPSTLTRGESAAGFARLSPDFDQLLARISTELGYPMAASVEQGEGNQLRVQATQEWLFNTARETKLMTALAVYQMWKNYNNGRPVDVTLVDSQGSTLIAINDRADGPELQLASPIASR